MTSVTISLTSGSTSSGGSGPRKSFRTRASSLNWLTPPWVPSRRGCPLWRMRERPEEGFAVGNCEIAFIGYGDSQKYIELSKEAKSTARKMGKPDLKVYGLVTLISGESDGEASSGLFDVRPNTPDDRTRRACPSSPAVYSSHWRCIPRSATAASSCILPQAIKELKPYLIGWRLLRLLPDPAGAYEVGSVDPPKTTFVSLAAMGERAQPLQGTAPSWRSKVQCCGCCRFADGLLAHVRTPGGPCATTPSSRSVFPASMSLLKLNLVEPPWYVTRMPGGVGGAAPRGVPLSRSISPSVCLSEDWCNPFPCA
jgi:hypothetical protein